MSRSVSAPSSVTNTSPCWNGLIVPGSTFRYGSHFCRVTLKPRLSRRQPVEEAATPFPSEETTPPVTKIYFGAIREARVPSPGLSALHRSDVHVIMVGTRETVKSKSSRSWNNISSVLLRETFFSRSGLIPQGRSMRPHGIRMVAAVEIPRCSQKPSSRGVPSNNTNLRLSPREGLSILPDPAGVQPSQRGEVPRAVLASGRSHEI